MSAHSKPTAPASAAAAIAPYPLTFEPFVLEKVWGGRALKRLGKHLEKPGAVYGEAWEIADLGATSSSGAGGGAFRSVIASGPMRGRTLAEAMSAWGEQLVAASAQGAPGGAAPAFPLLIKYLDARENLSVQVHPSPAYLARHPGEQAHLKTESWYVVDAEPRGGARLYIGLRPGTTRARFLEALKANAVEACLNAVPAVPGECHTLPSGTVHALGAGVLVAEVQTPSDTTFRVYDWGRKGRELHLEQALECIPFDGDAPGGAIAPPARASLPPNRLCARLASTPYYTIDEAALLPGDELTIGYRCCEGAKDKAAAHPKRPMSNCVVLMPLKGRGDLVWGEGQMMPLRPGETVLIPAAIAHSATIRAPDDRAAETLRVLRIGIV